MAFNELHHVHNREQKAWKRDRPVGKWTIGELKSLLEEIPSEGNDEKTVEELLEQLTVSQRTPVPEPQYNYADLQGLHLQAPYRLHESQAEAIQWMLFREQHPHHGIRGGLLSYEMGTGKTLISLSVCALNQGRTATLYICSKTLVGTIYQECEKFFGPQMKVLVFTAGVLQNYFFNFNEQTCLKNHLVVTTYDEVLKLAQVTGRVMTKRTRINPRLAQVGHAFFNSPWYRVIADESQRFANARSQLFKSLMCLKPGFRMCLTGTPIRNYEDDLFSQLIFCGLQGCNDIRDHTKQNFDALQLQTVVRVRSKDDCKIVLPNMLHHDIEVQFSAEQFEAYKYFLHASSQVLAMFQQDKKSVSFAVVLQKFTRLRQVCIAPHLVAMNTPAQTSSEAFNNWINNENSTAGIHSSKMLRMLQLLQGLPLQDRVLIFAEWSCAIDLVAKAIRKCFGEDQVLLVDGKTKDRDNVFCSFRQPNGPRFLCLTAVGTEGLTFTNANHVILLQPCWNEVFEKQASARVHRIGQTKEVHIWRLIVPHSIESKMIEISRLKRQAQDDLLKDTGIDANVLANLLQS